MSRNRRTGPGPRALSLVASGALAATGCYSDSMVDQLYHEPLEESIVFLDRPRIPENVVPFDSFQEDRTLVTGFATGMGGGRFVERSPIPTTAPVLDRGRERFEIFCTPCHDRAGTGTGIVIRRGFRSQPPSLHNPRLRDAPDGYLFDIITNGFGAMQDYGAEIPLADRWAIVAYIRALQLSQFAPLDAVPEDLRSLLEDQR